MKKIEITIKNEISKKVRVEEEDGNKREQNHSIAQHAEKEKGNIYTYNVYYSYLYFFFVEYGYRANDNNIVKLYFGGWRVLAMVQRNEQCLFSFLRCFIYGTR